jgi:PHD/YefM family antitoxin component YafN of YafNO toxin-antitoxin module
MTYKPFEKDLYDKYDSPAKEALLSYLEQEGHSIKNTVENYHADVTSTRKGATYYSEAEVKASWKEQWPESWAELRIPARKARLLKRHSIITFFVFRNDCKECWIVKGEQLTAETLKQAYGPNIRPGEMFFHIPVEEAKLIRHDENGWTEVAKEAAAASTKKTTTTTKNRKTKAVPKRPKDKPTDDSSGSSGDG